MSFGYLVAVPPAISFFLEPTSSVGGLLVVSRLERKVGDDCGELFYLLLLRSVGFNQLLEGVIALHCGVG